MMGVFSFAMSGGVLTGAVLAGTAMDMLGIRWAFYICAATVLILTVLAVRMIRSGERKELMATA
jgi:MFS family permease